MTAATTAKKSAPKKTPAKAPKASKKVAGETSKAFAVIATGGKQYIVRAGQNLKIEKIIGEYKVGDSLVFDSVLLTGGEGETKLGLPYIKGASVTATIKAIERLKKVVVIKYKQKSRYFKKNGHRQPYFEVTIDAIK